MRSQRLLVFWFALLFICGSVTIQGQSSTLISSLPEPLWQALLPTAQSLPSSYDLFVSTMQKQVDALTVNNGLLQTSNDSLTQENAGLRTSLKLSREAEATSESKSTLLQKDLSDSIASTIRAQGDAKALELKAGIWETAGIVASVAAADMAVKAFTGKDVLEWIVSLFKK